MKKILNHFFIILALNLSACGRSPDSQFYTLNPVYPKQKSIKVCKKFSLGINEIEGPAYLTKPQIMVQYPHQKVKLEEYHRWIENLKANIKAVVQANLSSFLSGAVIVNAPWDPKFKPDLRLQINILQLAVDIQGNSQLTVDYLIYKENKIKQNGTLVYHQKVTQVKIENLVASMNANLNRFSCDLARILARYC